jgi:hypothetical protein
MALTACDTGDVSLLVTVVIPPEIQSISSGVLRLGLWVYDPLLADAPAMLADADSVMFSHRQGSGDLFRMHVGAHVGAGLRYYITVRGYELSIEGERYVLWDGQQGTGSPTSVVMRPVSSSTGQLLNR